MNCPICNVALTMSERQGVEIDYCPQCRGVWLDRGELDKILDRAAGESDRLRDDDRERYDREREDDRREYGRLPGYTGRPEAIPPGRYPEPRYEERHYPKKRRRGFLDDLFDFD